MNEAMNGHGHPKLFFYGARCGRDRVSAPESSGFVFLGSVRWGWACRPCSCPASTGLKARFWSSGIASIRWFRPDQNAPMMFNDTVSEEDMNSEVELIGSDDVLRKVVEECGLQKKKSLLAIAGLGQSEDTRVAKAVRRLRSDLMVEPIKKSNMISVAYESSNPHLAAQVLDTLNMVYIQKHLEVHHPTGQAKFFEEQTEQYRKALADTETQLKEFDPAAGWRCSGGDA